MWSNLLQYAGPTDFIDILATSVLIYYFLLLIRGTRAVQILTGVLVLVVLLAVANLLHLLLLGTILQLIVLGAAVTLPIVFQPELRRALEQLGRGGFLRIGGSEGRRLDARGLAEIARAATLLANSRTGALIAIEQQTGLRDFYESGTLLHAALSAELLLAIFADRSPLHDGAVIVHENAIEAAACFLPLGDRLRSGHRLGTRHRAALGLSEQSDAVVVVVSEESGAVSVARNGNLSRPVEDEPRLFRLLLASTRPRRRVRGFASGVVGGMRKRIVSPAKLARGTGHSALDHPT